MLNTRFTRRLALRLAFRCIDLMQRREPSFIIGGREDPYLNRWYLIPRNPFLNVYLHEFMRSDDDRALHDHPWVSVSLMLGCRRGRAMEVSSTMTEIYRDRRGQECTRTVRIGSVVFRGARFAHRMIVTRPGAMTLFITGPKVRAWGFLCPNGWRHWKEFTASGDSARVGRGCE